MNHIRASEISPTLSLSLPFHYFISVFLLYHYLFYYSGLSLTHANRYIYTHTITSDS